MTSRPRSKTAVINRVAPVIDLAGSGVRGILPIDNGGNDSDETVVTASTDETVTTTTALTVADASSNDVTVTLPTAVGIPNRIYRIKRVDSSSNTVTVQAAGSETIDGSNTVLLSLQYDSINAMSDGSNWYIV